MRNSNKVNDAIYKSPISAIMRRLMLKTQEEKYVWFYELWKE